jgi:hypothetical protein
MLIYAYYMKFHNHVRYMGNKRMLIYGIYSRQSFKTIQIKMESISNAHVCLDGYFLKTEMNFCLSDACVLSTK